MNVVTCVEVDALQQLDRYAEDFGRLYAEYQDIHARLQLAGADMAADESIQERIYELANQDPLTGLPNRALCKDRLQQAIAMARRNNDGVGLLFIDLDRFKEVNDTFGHAVGDRVLVDFSWRVAHAIRDSDTAARLGGDEFVVVAPGVSGEEDMCAVAEKIIRSLAEPFVIEGREMYVGASIGAALYPTHGGSAEELLRQADVAMYGAKAEGGNACCLFDVALMLERVQRLDMEAALRQALARQQLRLAYQPLVDSRSGGIVGVEALLCWHWPEQGDVPADRFIPLAEATGLIVPIGEWVLRMACAQLAAWRKDGLPPLRMVVNVVARQLGDPAFADLVAAILSATATSPELLELDVAEDVLMACAVNGIDNLSRLRAQGVLVTVDHFGTGNSRLGRIRSLPIDRIKIDRSFVADMDRNPDSYATAHAIVALANALRLDVVAEGIERSEQAQLLSGFTCKEFQGHLYGGPQVPEAIAILIAQQKGEMP